MRETRSVSLPSVTRRPPTLSDGAEILCLWYRPCAPSLASRSHEQPVRYPCVKPVGFPNHLLSPSLPAPSLSGPVTSGEGRLQVHFAQWGESVGGTNARAYARARGSNPETALC